MEHKLGKGLGCHCAKLAFLPPSDCKHRSLMLPGEPGHRYYVVRDLCVEPQGVLSLTSCPPASGSCFSPPSSSLAPQLSVLARQTQHPAETESSQVSRGPGGYPTHQASQPRDPSREHREQSQRLVRPSIWPLVTQHGKYCSGLIR